MEECTPQHGVGVRYVHVVEECTPQLESEYNGV